jgi:hypothetical protein
MPVCASPISISNSRITLRGGDQVEALQVVDGDHSRMANQAQSRGNAHDKWYCYTVQ